MRFCTRVGEGTNRNPLDTILTFLLAVMAKLGKSEKKKKQGGNKTNGETPEPQQDKPDNDVSSENAMPMEEPLQDLNVEQEKKRNVVRQAMATKLRKEFKVQKLESEKRDNQLANDMRTLLQTITDTKTDEKRRKQKIFMDFSTKRSSRRPMTAPNNTRKRITKSKEPWRPPPSSTTSHKLFNATPRNLTPAVFMRPIETEEMFFLSPRSFRSKEGRSKHQDKIPLSLKSRQNFKLAIPQNEHGVFQYHRPLSARNPNEYPSTRPQSKTNNFTLVEKRLVEKPHAGRAHKHFRYHSHSNYMTAFNSAMAQKQVEYDTVVLQRALKDAIDQHRPTTSYRVRQGHSNLTNLLHADARPITAPTRPKSQRRWNRSGNFRAKQALCTETNSAYSKVVQARAYGHYNLKLEINKHDDVVQAFLMSKSVGKNCESEEKHNLRGLVRARANGLAVDEGKQKLIMINSLRSNVKVLEQKAEHEQGQIREHQKHTTDALVASRYARAYMNMSKWRYKQTSENHLRHLVALNSKLDPLRNVLKSTLGTMAAQISEEDLAQFRCVVDQNNKPIIRVPKDVKPLLSAIGWILGSGTPPKIEKHKVEHVAGKHKHKGKKKGKHKEKHPSFLKLIGDDEWEYARKLLFFFPNTKSGERLKIFIHRLEKINVEHVSESIRKAVRQFGEEWRHVFDKRQKAKKHKAGDNVALGLGQWLFGCLELWKSCGGLKTEINELERLNKEMKNRKGHYIHWKMQYKEKFDEELLCKQNVEQHETSLHSIVSEKKGLETLLNRLEEEMNAILKQLFGITAHLNDPSWINKMKTQKSFEEAQNAMFESIKACKVMVSVSLHIDQQHLFKISGFSSKNITAACRHSIEKITLCKQMETLAVPIIETRKGILCGFSADLSHFTAVFDNSEDAVHGSLIIKKLFNQNGLGKHRLTIFVDTFSGFSYGQRHECGVTHHRYGKHRQLYAMSSHRPALWASGNKSLVFISEEVEDELSKDLGRKLYFSKVTKGYYTLDVRMGHEHLLSNQKQTAVVENIVISHELNSIESVNIEKCFSRLITERTGLNRAKVVSQMWCDVAAMYWRKVGVLVIRCGQNNSFVGALPWHQPSTPKLFLGNHFKDEKYIYKVCEEMQNCANFDRAVHNIVNRRNPHKEKNTDADAFPLVLSLGPTKTSLFQPVRVCISRSISNIVEVALELRKQKLPLKMMMTYGSALISSEGDFLSGPVVQQMEKMHRRRPVQTSTIAIDRVAKSAIDFEQFILPHTGWEIFEG